LILIGHLSRDGTVIETRERPARPVETEQITGDYSIWITSWGEPLMVPQDGPDKTCGEIFLHQRMQKVLETKPK